MENKIGILCYTTEEDTTIDEVGVITNKGYSTLIYRDIEPDATGLSIVKGFIQSINKKDFTVEYVGDFKTNEDGNTVYVYAVDITSSRFSFENFNLI